MKTILIILLLLACPAYPRQFYFGIKAGTPFTDSTPSADVSSRAGVGSSTLNVRRYAIGPTVEVSLPFHLAVEADALYGRLDRTDHSFLGPTFGNITRQKANTWQFPLLLKYSWTRSSLRPFAEAGGTFRRIQSFDTSREDFTGGFDPPYRLSQYRIDEPLTQGGMAFGGGLRIAIWHSLKVTPEIRYTRWTSLRFFPTKNQVEFFLGLGF